MPSPVPKDPLGSAKMAVNIVAILYLVSSLLHIRTLIQQREWYYANFHYMPLWQENLRYLFSWLQRIFGLACATGLLLRKEIVRKVLIGFNFFVVATVYWKHPYPGFLRHTQYLDQLTAGIRSRLPFRLSFEDLTIPSLVTHCVFDIVFCVAVVYILTRPEVKRVFH